MKIVLEKVRPFEDAAWSIRGSAELLTEAAALLYSRLAVHKNDQVPLSEAVLFHLAHLLDTVAGSMRRHDDLPHAVVSAATDIAYYVTVNPNMATIVLPSKAPVPAPLTLREKKAS
jgi:hypothetical protein